MALFLYFLYSCRIFALFEFLHSIFLFHFKFLKNFIQKIWSYSFPSLTSFQILPSCMFFLLSLKRRWNNIKPERQNLINHNKKLTKANKQAIQSILWWWTTEHDVCSECGPYILHYARVRATIFHRDWFLQDPKGSYLSFTDKNAVSTFIRISLPLGSQQIKHILEFGKS